MGRRVGFCRRPVDHPPRCVGVRSGCIFLLPGVVCYSLSRILTRRFSGAGNLVTTYFYTGRVGLIIASAAGQADWAVPDGFAACLMVGLGLSAGIGHYLRIMAFQHIDPAANALFFYAQRVWAMLFGVAFFGELPDALSLASMLIIVGSGLFVALLR